MHKLLMLAALVLLSTPIAAQTPTAGKFLYVQNDGLDVVRVYENGRFIGRVYPGWGECVRLLDPSEATRTLRIVPSGGHPIDIQLSPTDSMYSWRVQTYREFEGYNVVPTAVCVQKRPGARSRRRG